MPHRMAALRSIFIWLAIAVMTVCLFCIMLPASLLALPFDRKKNTAHYIARFWARGLMRLNPAARVIIEGEENLALIGGTGAAILCANHQSMADIIALCYLGYPFKWISKREILFIPIIGQAMWLAGYIFLRRGDKASIKRMMASCRAWMGKGVSIMMFPEGTRSEDGRLKSFKDGAFRMAEDGRVPVVPIVLDGTRGLVEKGSWIFAKRVELRVRVGPPIPPVGSGPEEVKRLRDLTRAWILANMVQMTGRTPEDLDASPDSAQSTVPGNNAARVGV
jgi:1-acyl-sn-glycerol-3-phosphate acyltransferase